MTEAWAILASLDQLIERFARENRLRDGHLSATREGPVAALKLFTRQRICHIGHSGHIKEEGLAEADHEHCHSPQCSAENSDKGLAREVISVYGQSGQSPKNHGLAPGHRDTSCGQSGHLSWCAHYEERSRYHELAGQRSRAEAQLLAWHNLGWRWHKQRGEQLPQDICCGCRKPIGTAEAMPLIDGNRLHCGEQHKCLVAYGRRWRSKASTALLALGLTPPDGLE